MKNRVKKSIEITDAKIDFVSLVDKAANQRRFLFAKSEDSKPQFVIKNRIIKANDDSHVVIGVVYEPMEADAHDNFMTAEEIQKAADYFNENGLGNDVQHNEIVIDGVSIIKSWVTTEDQEMFGEVIKAGTWLMEVEVVNDEIWKSIEDGEISGFSMGGTGLYSTEDVEIDDVEKSTNILQAVAKALGLEGLLKKGEVADRFNASSQWDIWYNAKWALDDTLLKWNDDTWSWEFEKDEDKVREALEEYSAIVTAILTNENMLTDMLNVEPSEELIEKMESRKESEETSVKKEDIQNIVAEAVKKAMESQETPAEPATPETPAEPVVKSEDEMTDDQLKEMVRKSLVEAGAIEKSDADMTVEEKIAKFTAEIMAESKGSTQQIDTEITKNASDAPVVKSYVQTIKNAGQ